MAFLFDKRRVLDRCDQTGIRAGADKIVIIRF